MTLNEIIKRKKEEFDAGFAIGIGRKWTMTVDEATEVKSFLEKAIRESVEEALREVRPEDYMAYELTEAEGGYGMCLEDLDKKVEEFMK